MGVIKAQKQDFKFLQIDMFPLKERKSVQAISRVVPGDIEWSKNKSGFVSNKFFFFFAKCAFVVKLFH